MEHKQNFFSRIFRHSGVITTMIPIDNARCDLANLLTYKVFSSPEIQVAINFISEIFSTIPTYHRRTDSDGTDEYLHGNIYNILNVEPNALQNRTQFWVSAISQLLKNNNLIIYPEWSADMRTLLSIIPLPIYNFQPQKNSQGEYVVFIDTDQGRKEYNIRKLIILNKFNTLQGGGNNRGISLYEQVMQESMKRAIEQLKNPKDIQAYLQLRQFTTLKEDAAKARAKEVIQQITSGEVSANGLNLPFIQGDIELKSVDIKAIPIDKDLLNYAKGLVYNYFGLTDRIIQRQVSDFEWQIWVATTIAPLARQCEEEFSRKLFTPTERFHGNWIEFDLTSLQVATLRDKTSFAYQMLPMGVINANEARERFGYGKKLNGLGDNYKQTLNLADEEMVNEYQMTNASNGRLPIQQNQTEVNTQ